MCCHHGQSLLDANQEVPWSDQYLEMQFKFRFYYQEYRPATALEPVASHKALVRLYWITETFAGEYDVPQCAPSTPPELCVHAITSRFKVRDSVQVKDGVKGIELIYAGPHCHAPSCLSMELYNADTGELLCRSEPVVGQSGELYDEKGFVAIPPCLWGSPEEGLLPPPFLTLNTNLFCIKRNNNTMGHTGEMASWQMRGVWVKEEEQHEFPGAVSRTSLRGVGGV